MERVSTTLEFSLSKQNGTILDNSKFSPASQNVNDSLSSDYGSRANKADEMFKNLIERVNRSREYIESVHRSTFSSNSSEPTKDNPITLKTNDDKPLTSQTLTKHLPPTILKQESLKLISTQPSTKSALTEKESKQKSSRDELSLLDHSIDFSEEYGRMSHEIHEFKEQLLEKVRRNKVKEEAAAPAISTQTKKSHDRIKKFDLLSSDEEEEEVKTFSHAAAGKKPAPQKSINTSVKNSGAKPTKNTQAVIAAELPIASHMKVSKSKKPDAIGSIHQLKNALNDRETLLQEKYVNLKFRSKELRNTLQEYVNKCLDLEDALKSKDQQLQESQKQNQQLQTELNKQADITNELTKQQEAWSRAERALIDNNKALIESQAQVKIRLEELESLAKANETKYLIQIQTLQAEKQERKDDALAKEGIISEQKRLVEAQRIDIVNLKKECEFKDAHVLQLETVNSDKLQDYQKLREQIEDMDKSSKAYAATIEDLKEKNSQSQEKITKLKKKLEDERHLFQEEKQTSLHSKKEKIKQLRAELKHSENVYQKLSDEKKALEFEAGKLTSFNSALERTVEQLKGELIGLQQQQKVLTVINVDLKQQNEEISKSYQSESEKAAQYKSELKKVTKQVKKFEEKLGVQEKDFIKADEMTDQMKNQVKVLIEENTNLREYITQLEFSIGSLTSQQEQIKETTKAQIGDLEKQLQKSKEEIALLRLNEARISKELEVTQDERDQFKKENKTLKQVNRAIEKDFREIDLKVKEFIAERDQQAQELSERQFSLKNQASSKLQALDEIQNLIKSHRLNYNSNKENVELNRFK